MIREQKLVGENFKENGVSYRGSTQGWGSCSPGSIPGTPTNQDISNFQMSNLVAIAERSSNLFWTKLRLIAPPKAEQKTERSGGQKGRGLGGRIFCSPSLSDSDLFAAEFRISFCEMRRPEKKCCACPARPCAHNRFLLPLFFTKNKFCSIIVVVLISLAILQYNSTTINNLCQGKIIHYRIT